MRSVTYGLAFLLIPSLMAFAPLGSIGHNVELVSCETTCAPVGGGQNIEHYTFWNLNGEQEYGEEGWHFYTKTGSCAEEHPDCVEADLDIDALMLAVASADLDALGDVVAAQGGAVLVNTMRGELQAYGCGGDVVASLPLSPSQLSGLTQ